MPFPKRAGFVALGRVARPEDAVHFISSLTSKSETPDAQAGAAEGLASAWSKVREGWTLPDSLWTALSGLLLVKDGREIPAATALARYRGEKKDGFAAPLLKALPRIQNETVKTLVVRTLGSLKKGIR